jgi:hypothetical protein
MNGESIFHKPALSPGTRGSAALGIAASSAPSSASSALRPALRPALSAALRHLWRRARASGQQILRLSRLCLSRRKPRRLRLCESLPLGERRFVAVVEFERSRFLVGGTSGSLVLLARLGSGQMDEAEEEDAASEKNGRSISAPADPPADAPAEAQP